MTADNSNSKKMKRKEYEKHLDKLQVELCRLQDWVKAEGIKVIVLFEGRDAAGKGGTIKAITERVSPRVFRVVALPAPSDREKSQMYIQRYITHFPAAGEIVIFDRSWYNRAGVEYVMGFIDEHQHKHFLEVCPTAERYMVNSGITLIKIWLEVGQEEQERRFDARINDPLRQWKLSPMDLESYRRWYACKRLERYPFLLVLGVCGQGCELRPCCNVLKLDPVGQDAQEGNRLVDRQIGVGVGVRRDGHVQAGVEFEAQQHPADRSSPLRGIMPRWSPAL